MLWWTSQFLAGWSWSFFQAPGGDPRVDPRAPLSSGFTTLRRHFLQQVRRAKRKRRFQDPERRGFSPALLERLGAAGFILFDG